MDEWSLHELYAQGLRDIISLWVTQILQTYGDEASKAGSALRFTQGLHSTQHNSTQLNAAASKKKISREKTKRFSVLFHRSDSTLVHTRVIIIIIIIMQSIYTLVAASNRATKVPPSTKDGAPVCEGSVDDLVGRPIFLALYPYFLKYGGVFKLAFGPKVFMVLSDPVVVREVLKEKPFAFSKGVLAEILEPIMGQGLIPAPYAVWKNRRRQLVPGFHKAWLDHMVGLFGGGATAGSGGREIILSLFL